MQNVLKLIPIILFAALGYWGSMHLINASKEKKAAERKERLAQMANYKKSGKSGRQGQKKPKNVREAKRAGKKSMRQNAQETTVAILSPKDYKVELTTQGVVRARTVTKLNPLVSGRISKINDNFQDGAFFKQGDTLVELDPSDFETQIINAEASLARSKSSLAQEEARAAQALRNWKDIGFDDKPNDLVLRKPQLNEARANVAAQVAAVAKAKRELVRAKVLAPFDGRVRTRKVGPGQSVGAGTELGEIYATDYAEVRLPLSARQLTQIDINEQGHQSINVTLTDALNANRTTTWNAKIKYVEGELDEDSRELYVIAHISDPFGTKAKANAKAKHEPLRINQPVIAKIEANTIKDAYIISRKHLYSSNEILLVEDHSIIRRSIDIVWSAKDYVITTDPTLKGKTLATSRLNFAKTGTPINVIKEKKKKPKDDPTASAEETSKVERRSLLQKLKYLDRQDILTGNDFIKAFPDSKFTRHTNPGIAVMIPPSDHWNIDSNRTLVLFPIREIPQSIVLETLDPGDIQEQSEVTPDPFFIRHGIYSDTKYSRFRLAGERGLGLYESRVR